MQQGEARSTPLKRDNAQKKGTHVKNKIAKRPGFTIIELLIVISIMAVVATLATGAALKSIKNSRKKRIAVTVQALETALVNYRALHGEWPIKFDDDEHDGKIDSVDVIKGSNNSKVFEPLMKDIRNKKALLDTSALLTRVNGKRMTVKQALEKSGNNDIPIGYADPSNQDEFKFYTVEFDFRTETVNVKQAD